MNLIDLVIAWVMFILIPATDTSSQVVRIVHVTARTGQEVQADAADRWLAARPLLTYREGAGSKHCRGPPETPEGRA